MCSLLLLSLAVTASADTWLGPNKDLEVNFQRLDQNKDQIVDLDEFLYLEDRHVNSTLDFFKATDINEDGNLTMNEMIAYEAIKQANGDHFAAPNLAKGHFFRLDQDYDGVVTFNEYLRRDPMYTEELKEVFRHVDINNDNQLTLEEFKNFPENEQERNRKERRRNFEFIFNHADLNKDGKVNLEELREFVVNGFFPKKTYKIASTPRGFDEIAKNFDLDKNGGLNVDELFEFKEKNPYTEMECLISKKIE
ncbi:hypothetical protein L596_010769 [Steinernema carpocapsae]|uniref:EF-hand domain-containing protein n=1 Tax=Steinernema carpocapsae TaxID=34508 RepID=A0A4U5PJL0_STECR|nr:hypothetical protein L596_010769 [Steinernema carpocapsae]